MPLLLLFLLQTVVYRDGINSLWPEENGHHLADSSAFPECEYSNFDCVFAEITSMRQTVCIGSNNARCWTGGWSLPEQTNDDWVIWLIYASQGFNELSHSDLVKDINHIKNMSFSCVLVPKNLHVFTKLTSCMSQHWFRYTCFAWLIIAVSGIQVSIQNSKFYCLFLNISTIWPLLISVRD